MAWTQTACVMHLTLKRPSQVTAVNNWALSWPPSKHGKWSECGVIIPSAHAETGCCHGSSSAAALSPTPPTHQRLPE